MLARYDRKPQFLIGRITNVRTDGSFDIRYDSGAEETRVDRALIVPVSGVEEKALSKKGGKSDKAMSGFDDLKEKALSSKERQKQNFLELYAKREAARQEEIQALQEVEKPSGRVVGSDCESQVCGACKLIVDEFGKRNVLIYLFLVTTCFDSFQHTKFMRISITMISEHLMICSIMCNPFVHPLK